METFEKPSPQNTLSMIVLPLNARVELHTLLHIGKTLSHLLPSVGALYILSHITIRYRLVTTALKH